MKVGRELDLRVAEEVMGLRRLGQCVDYGDCVGAPPEYSGSIAIAWPVWEMLIKAEPYSWVIYFEGDGEVCIEYYGEDRIGCRIGGGDWTVTGSALDAICHAALRWKETKKEGQRMVTWKVVADIGKAAAEKFVAKVEDGRARSVETYADMKAFLAAYKAAARDEKLRSKKGI